MKAKFSGKTTSLAPRPAASRARRAQASRFLPTSAPEVSCTQAQSRRSGVELILVLIITPFKIYLLDVFGSVKGRPTFLVIVVTKSGLPGPLLLFGGPLRTTCPIRW